MRIRYLYRFLIVGTWLGLSVACQGLLPSEETPIPGTLVVMSTATPPGTAVYTTPPPTPQQPDPPTPAPTATPDLNRPTPANWQTFVQSETGLVLSAPAGWVNVGDLANLSSLAAALGQEHILLLADTLETGVAVLTNRPVTNGGFALAIYPSENSTPTGLELSAVTNPSTMLQNILSRQGESGTVLSIPQGPLPGAYAAVSADPTTVIAPTGTMLWLRQAVYLHDENSRPRPVYLLMGADPAVQGSYEPIFNDMMGTLAVQRDERETTPDGIRFLRPTDTGDGRRDTVIDQLPAGSEDFWAFEAEGGQYASLRLTPGESTSDLTLSILTPSGRTLLDQDSGYGGDAEVLTDQPLAESGVYIVRIQEFFGEADRYTLSLEISDEPIYGGGGQIGFNQEVQGQLPAGGEDIWTFSGQAGQVASVVLEPAGEFDALFVLYSPDGREIATFDEGYSGDAEVLANYALPFTGDYTVAVRSFGENGGRYTLALDEGNEDVANFYEAGDLAYGDARRELLRPNEAHVWFVSGRAGDEIELTATPLGDNIDLDVWLLDPDQRRLAMQDEMLSGEAEIVNYTLPRDGEYIVVVQEFFGEEGEYELELQVSGDNYLISSGEIEYGETVASALPSGRGTIWQFAGEEGDVVDLTLAPVNPESDFVLSVRDPDAQPVLQMDDTLAGRSEQIDDFVLSAGGVWTVVVQEYFDDGGSYRLTLEKEE